MATKTTPGYKTSEFYLSAAATLGGLFLAGGFLPDEHLAVRVVGGAMSLLAQLGYQYFRTSLKK
jgi:hypothetical protein